MSLCPHSAMCASQASMQGWCSVLCCLLIACSCGIPSYGQEPLTDFRRRQYPEVPYQRIEDHNITYIELQGVDPEIDEVHRVPEAIVVRLFLAAQYQGDRIKLKISIMRESLATELEFGQHCSKDDPKFCTDWYWQCPTHPWQPNITLANSNHTFPVNFMDDVPGLWPYLRACKHYSDIPLWDNAHPYFAQALLPPSADGQTFTVALAGFTQRGMFTLHPQTRPDPEAAKPVWNIMKMPGISNDDKAYAISLVFNTKYHLSIGYTGTLAIVSFKDAVALLTHREVHVGPCTYIQLLHELTSAAPQLAAVRLATQCVFDVFTTSQAGHLIRAGKLQLLLWESYDACHGYARCYAEDRFAVKWPVAYQPLQFTVAALFLWRYDAYVSFADIDEFLMINIPDRTVSDLLYDKACYAGLSQIKIPHHSIQTANEIEEAHWAHWHQHRKHSAEDILSEYVYRSVAPDETGKPMFLSEDTISCNPHYVILQNYDKAVEFEEVNTSCAAWGHIRDWWGYRGNKWVTQQLTPEQDKTGKYWAQETTWMWALE